MSQVITITLNPAIDQILEIPDFHVGGVLSVKESRTYPAGKGVNVARTLSCLDKEVLAMGIVGLEDEPFFNTVSTDYLAVDWILKEGSTRVNLTINDPLNATETHIRAVTHDAGEFPLQELKEKLVRHYHDGDLVVLSGSLPANAPEDTLYQLGRFCGDRQIPTIIDSSGKAMTRALEAAPFLIKPNVEELQEITGNTYNTDLEIARAAQELASHFHINIVIVSMGKEGALAFDRIKHKAYRAKLALDEQMEDALHAVGSGDAMIGGICSGLVENENLEMILRKGMAAGAANLFTEAPGVISANLFKQLVHQVVLYEMNLD